MLFVRLLLPKAHLKHFRAVKDAVAAGSDCRLAFADFRASILPGGEVDRLGHDHRPETAAFDLVSTASPGQTLRGRRSIPSESPAERHWGGKGVEGEGVEWGPSRMLRFILCMPGSLCVSFPPVERWLLLTIALAVPSSFCNGRRGGHDVLEHLPKYHYSRPNLFAWSFFAAVLSGTNLQRCHGHWQLLRLTVINVVITSSLNSLSGRAR